MKFLAKIFKFLIFSVIIYFLLFEPMGFSQEKEGKKVKELPPPPKVIEMEAITVEGRIQKPQVFLILGRGELRYKKTEEKKSFVNEVIKSVEENPF